MVTLESYHEKYQEALNYQLSEEQAVFTGLPSELLERSQTNPGYKPIVILFNQEVAGFFVLDSGEDKFHYTDQEKSLLLRGYSIHPNFQGKGIAKASLRLLPAFIKQLDSDIEQIVLGVNEANKPAQGVYTALGFIDEGRRYMGTKGEQIAMVLHIRDIIIRKALPGDEQGIVDVCIAGQWNTYKNLYSKEYIEKVIEKFYTVERIKKEIEETNKDWNGYFVAVLDNQIVGAIGGGVYDENIAEVYVLYLDPEKRNLGIGTKLLQYLTDVQKNKYGATEQWVSVAKDNMLGIPFYEARGFIYQGEQQAYESNQEDNTVSLRYKRNI